MDSDISVRTVRKWATQGHHVPDLAYRALGPFNPEILARPKLRTEDLSPVAGDTDERLFRCRDCDAELTLTQTTTHDCEE